MRKAHLLREKEGSAKVPFYMEILLDFGRRGTVSQPSPKAMLLHMSDTIAIK